MDEKSSENNSESNRGAVGSRITSSIGFPVVFRINDRKPECFPAQNRDSTDSRLPQFVIFCTLYIPEGVSDTPGYNRKRGNLWIMRNSGSSCGPCGKKNR